MHQSRNFATFRTYERRLVPVREGRPRSSSGRTAYRSALPADSSNQHRRHQDACEREHCDQKLGHAERHLKTLLPNYLRKSKVDRPSLAGGIHVETEEGYAAFHCGDPEAGSQQDTRPCLVTSRREAAALPESSAGRSANFACRSSRKAAAASHESFSHYQRVRCLFQGCSLRKASLQS